MGNSNEPEIDAAIAEQEAINRMRWQAVLAILPRVRGDDCSAITSADNVVEEFVNTYGVVK